MRVLSEKLQVKTMVNTPCSPQELRNTVNILFHQFDQYIADLTP